MDTSSPKWARGLMTAAVVAFGCQQASAVVIGTDDFGYPEGSIVGQAGGNGWLNVFVPGDPGTPPAVISYWRSAAGGPASVTGGNLVTNGTGAIRSYNGGTLGAGGTNNEREGAIRGSGAVYYAVDFTATSLLNPETNQWAGASSFDFGGERIFFGMPGQGGETRYFGIEESGVGRNLSAIPIHAEQTYRLVMAVDFDNDLLKLWVNPDGSDFDNGSTHSADVSRSYTATNWSTAVRLASGGGVDIFWDNLVVATTFEEAMIPEPSALVLGLLGLLPLARRRR